MKNNDGDQAVERIQAAILETGATGLEDLLATRPDVERDLDEMIRAALLRSVAEEESWRESHKTDPAPDVRTPPRGA